MGAMENPKSKTSNLVPNPVLLSLAFTLTPFASPFFRPRKLDLAPVFPQNVIRDLHHSIISTADDFMRSLNSFASQNPVFKKALSLYSEFQSFCREITTCRNQCMKLNIPLSSHSFAAILPGDSVAEIVVTNGILNFLNIYNTLLIIRLVLTWFPNSPPAIVSPLSTLCDPYLNIFRGIIPPLGGTLDLSPILAFLVLNAFTSTAAALPAELPVPGQSPSPTSSQRKWIKRLRARGTQAKSSAGVK